MFRLVAVVGVNELIALVAFTAPDLHIVVCPETEGARRGLNV